MERAVRLGEMFTTARGGRSRRHVAHWAGISDGWVKAIEEGYRHTGGHRIVTQASIETLAHLADAVGLNRADVMEAAGHDRQAADVVPYREQDMGDLIDQVRKAVDALAAAWKRGEAGPDRPSPPSDRPNRPSRPSTL